MTRIVKSGDRIKLVSMDDQFTHLKPGDTGEVIQIKEVFKTIPSWYFVQIWIRWDKLPNFPLALIEGRDTFEIIS